MRECVRNYILALVLEFQYMTGSIIANPLRGRVKLCKEPYTSAKPLRGNVRVPSSSKRLKALPVEHHLLDNSISLMFIYSIIPL